MSRKQVKIGSIWLIWNKSTSKSAFYDTLRIFTNAYG